MAYNKNTWADGPSGGTPLSAARLNHMEDGIAAATVDLDGTPLELRATASTYPARPATTRPVHFIGPTAPAGDGSTAGGGGMVPGIDSWFWWAPQ